MKRTWFSNIPEKQTEAGEFHGLLSSKNQFII